MDNRLMPLSFMRTLRLRVRTESYPRLTAAANEVNQVFNYDTRRRTDLRSKWLSGFDLCNLTAGATQYYERIGADTNQSASVHYAQMVTPTLSSSAQPQRLLADRSGDFLLSRFASSESLSSGLKDWQNHP